MDKDVVVLIKSSPQESHRPVEAIRIALGLLSGEHKVSLILIDKSLLLLGDEAEDLIDGEELGKYLPPLKELGQTFYVEKEALERTKLADTDFKIKPLSIQEISQLIAQAHCHLIF